MRRGRHSTPSIAMGVTPQRLRRALEDIGEVIVSPPSAGSHADFLTQVIADNINATRVRPIRLKGVWDIGAKITIPRVATKTPFSIRGDGPPTLLRSSSNTIFDFDTGGVTGGVIGDFNVELTGSTVSANPLIDFNRLSEFVCLPITSYGAHNAYSLGWTTKGWFYGLRARDPINAETTADSALLRLRGWHNGASWRRATNVRFIGIDLAAMSVARDKDDCPRFCLDIEGVDGFEVDGGHINGAYCGVRFKPKNGLDVTGEVFFTVYNDNLDLGTFGYRFETETDGNGGTIGAVHIDGYSGNCDGGNQTPAEANPTAIYVQKPPSRLVLGERFRTGGAGTKKAVFLTGDGSNIFINHGELAAVDYAIDVSGAQGVLKLGGTYKGTSVKAVNIPAVAIDAVIWDDAVFVENSGGNIANAATIGQETGNGVSDDADTYWDAFGGSGGWPDWTTIATPTVEFQSGGPATFSWTARSLKHKSLGRQAIVDMRATGQVTNLNGATGLFQMLSPIEPDATQFLRQLIQIKQNFMDAFGIEDWYLQFSSDGGGGGILRYYFIDNDLSGSGGSNTGLSATHFTASAPNDNLNKDFDFRASSAMFSRVA